MLENKSNKDMNSVAYIALLTKFCTLNQSDKSYYVQSYLQVKQREAQNLNLRLVT